MTIPALGLGTYRLQGQALIDSVTNALELGYRLIDTAQIYENEADIGQALAASAVPRSAIFLTTKVWPAHFARDRVIPSLKESLVRLRTDYVDLALIHWPSPNQAEPLADTLGALMEAKTQGLTKHIGISNFTIALMREAIAAVGVANLATNQIELSPYLQNRKVLAFAQQQGVHISSYMTLAYGKVLQDPVLKKIAQRHHATPAQVALAWAMQLGCAVIPSSTKRENLRSNLQAQQLHLTDADMVEIALLERNERLANPDGLAPRWD